MLQLSLKRTDPFLGYFGYFSPGYLVLGRAPPFYDDLFIFKEENTQGKKTYVKFLCFLG